MKNEISQQSKKNFELENDLRFFDSKIAHLINHRITVEVNDAYVLPLASNVNTVSFPLCLGTRE